MMKSSNSESNQSLIIPENFQRSLSPSGRFCSSSISSVSSHSGSSSPNQVAVHRNSLSLSPPVRYNSPATSSTKTESNSNISSDGKKKKMCICAPTTHPGSFRCRFHKSVNNNDKFNPSSIGCNTVSYHRLNARRSAMSNSLVRIGTEEGDLMKRALAALIRPSWNQLKRRDDFKPKPSRLSVMSKPEDELVLV